MGLRSQLRVAQETSLSEATKRGSSKMKRSTLHSVFEDGADQFDRNDTPHRRSVVYKRTSCWRSDERQQSFSGAPRRKVDKSRCRRSLSGIYRSPPINESHSIQGFNLRLSTLGLRKFVWVSCCRSIAFVSAPEAAAECGRDLSTTLEPRPQAQQSS